jgi:hypothetical protein
MVEEPPYTAHVLHSTTFLTVDSLAVLAHRLDHIYIHHNMHMDARKHAEHNPACTACIWVLNCQDEAGMEAIQRPRPEIGGERHLPRALSWCREHVGDNVRPLLNSSETSFPTSFVS